MHDLIDPHDFIAVSLVTDIAPSPDLPPSITAAGFAILREDENSPGGYRMLGLLCDDAYDMPKGKLEPGEDDLQGALRELREETNISKVEMPWGEISTVVNTLRMYIGTTKQWGYITANPTTGVVEHERLRWLSFDELEMLAEDFLVPVVQWARAVSGELGGINRGNY